MSEMDEMKSITVTLLVMFRVINRFIFQLRLKIKLMSDADFAKLLKECDYQQTLYALYFRYC